MYRVILVDDEPWILKGIVHAFAWWECGFEVVGSYLNPQEALDHIMRERIDAVFTDIRMPEMDGIELMQRVREENRQTEVVIISGYGQFEYAQQALRLGAFDYILKPIDDAATKTLLPRLRERLDENKEARSRILLEWIVEAEAEAGKDIQSLIPQTEKGYQVIAFAKEERQTFYEILSQTPEIRWIPFSLGQKRYAIINTGRDLNELLKLKAVGFLAGVSSWVEELLKIPTLAQQANLAHMQSFITGESDVYVYRSRQPEEIAPFVKRAFQLLNDAQMVEFQSLILSLPKLFVQQQLTMADLAALWNQFADYAQAHFPDRTQNSELQRESDAQQFLQRFSGIAELCQYLYEEMRNFAMLQKEDVVRQEGEKNFNRMIRYLNTNYTQQMQLQDLAKQYFINKTYACYLFKKNIGMTYTEYINTIRIAKSKELLTQSSLSVNEISERVGYADCFYFGRLFKRMVGLTPSQFRKQPWAASGERK